MVKTKKNFDVHSPWKKKAKTIVKKYILEMNSFNKNLSLLFFFSIFSIPFADTTIYLPPSGEITDPSLTLAPPPEQFFGCWT